MEEIKYLYHYTSIESLALILRNKTIRLNPLDKMDDLQEQKTADVENLGKFVFVSSWTDDPTESIPMWKMYANPASGIRIKLRANPFLWHETSGADIERVLGIPAKDDASRNAVVKTFLNLSKMLDGGYYSPALWKGDILVQTTYTNDISLLEPQVAKYDGENITIHTGALGKHKNLHWSFQKEWRYLMQFMPIDFKAALDDMPRLITDTTEKLLKGTAPPPFRYFDLDIDPQYFEEMEITCSPQMTFGNRVILETLVEKYNPSATIRESELMNLI